MWANIFWALESQVLQHQCWSSCAISQFYHQYQEMKNPNAVSCWSYLLPFWAHYSGLPGSLWEQWFCSDPTWIASIKVALLSSMLSFCGVYLLCIIWKGSAKVVPKETIMMNWIEEILKSDKKIKNFKKKNKISKWINLFIKRISSYEFWEVFANGFNLKFTKNYFFF